MMNARKRILEGGAELVGCRRVTARYYSAQEKIHVPLEGQCSKDSIAG